MQSILQISLSNSTSKGSVAAKKFKDIRHYDSMRHDHAAYERKQDDKLKESKAKQKKKREEAEKLPEVSKEMCCNIQFSSAQPPSCLTLCDPMNRSTPGLPVHPNSRSLPKPMSIVSVVPSSHLILCRPLLLPPSIFPSIRVFSN